MSRNLTHQAPDARAEQPPLAIAAVLVLEESDVALLRDALLQLPRRTARRAQLLARLQPNGEPHEA